MLRVDLINSDAYVDSYCECLIRSGKKITTMRSDMSAFIKQLRDELKETNFVTNTHPGINQLNMTHKQHLTTIAEFMGWEYYNFYSFFYKRNEQGLHIKRLDADSFDTMRMVLDKFKDVDINPANSDDYSTHKKICYDIIQILGWGTPSDCAARRAEAIEWWKSVK